MLFTRRFQSSLAASARNGPRITRLWPALLGTTMSLGCGGRADGGQSGLDSGTPIADGGSHPDSEFLPDAGLPLDASEPWSEVCPDTLPALGSACLQPQLECEYGNAWWNVSCDSSVYCNNGTWASLSPSSATCLPAPGPNPASCPSGGFIGEGMSCPQVGLTCFYGEGAQC